MRAKRCFLSSLQLSAQLKTRLSYAMVKVQNGWEKRSLDELEAMPPKHLSPSLSSGDSPRSDRRRRLSVNSENSERYITSPSTLTSPSTFSRYANGTPSSK